MDKPLIKINKFFGAGDGRMFYNEEFLTKIENGNSVILPYYVSNNVGNIATTGLSDLDSYIVATLHLGTVNQFLYKYKIFLTDAKDIFSQQTTTDSVIATAKIHTISTSQSVNPDLLETANGNILYNGERYIGRGVRFKATGGTTTTIIDTTKNFVTLGFAANDKVTNLKTGIEYTITSITTTTNTNDTLNFTASGSNSTSAGDEIIAWEDDRFDMGSSVREVWQNEKQYWARQMKQYGDQYLIANGNYLSIISADESTIDATYKQLPARHQALALETNQDKILISAEFNGLGKLLLWDNATNGWLNILEFDKPIKALTPYDTGWVFVSRGIIYFTNGYQIKKLSDYGVSVEPSYFNGISTFFNRIYFCNTTQDFNRGIPGVYVFDFKQGWSIVKCFLGSYLNGIPTTVSIGNNSILDSTIYIGGYKFLDSISEDANYSDASDNRSFIYYAVLPQYVNVKGIGLQISPSLYNYLSQTSGGQCKIGVSIGDGRRGVFSKAQSTSTTISETTIEVNGTSYVDNQVGDEVIVLGDLSGVSTLVGERTFIQSIANKGLSNETWTVSPAFSTTDTTDNVQLKMVRVRNFGIKTIPFNELNNEVLFFDGDGVQGNKLFIEVVVYGVSNAFNPQIEAINIYGN